MGLLEASSEFFLSQPFWKVESGCPGGGLGFVQLPFRSSFAETGLCVTSVETCKPHEGSECYAR